MYGLPPPSSSSANFGPNSGPGSNFGANTSQPPPNFGSNNGQPQNFGSNSGQNPNFGGNTAQSGSFSGSVPPMNNPGAYGSYGYNYGFVPNAYPPYNSSSVWLFLDFLPFFSWLLFLETPALIFIANRHLDFVLFTFFTFSTYHQASI